MNDELVWDNGTNLPEPCIDRIADTVGKVGVSVLLRILYFNSSSNLYLYLVVVDVLLSFSVRSPGLVMWGLGIFCISGIFGCVER